MSTDNPTPTPRWCYAVFETQRAERGYIPSVVTEGEPGHQPLIGRDDLSEPWYWGQTFEDARSVCEKANAERGISVEDAEHIVASSIAAQIGQDARRDAQRQRMQQLGMR